MPNITVLPYSLHLTTLKTIAKLKSAITSFSITYAKAWTKPRENERRNSKVYSGLRGPPNTTRESPFLLAYRIEAIILVDICMPTLRVEGVIPDQNDTQLHLMLDHSEERNQ